QSLGKMARAGLAVPDSFFVTADAYKRFIEVNRLQTVILDLAVPKMAGQTVSFEAGSKRIQALIGKAELSDEMQAEIRNSYSELDGQQPAVAVRSSANAEDLPDMSFAGQQDTYLNIRGEDELILAIRDCWASLWASRAISYRHQMGVEQSAVAMAVVVQKMVLSDLSGILFTANPATGDRDELIVNASYGLGEAVVGGQVTPDTYILDRNTLKAKETIIGTKELKIVPDGNHGTRIDRIAKNEQGKSSMSGDALRELSSIALDIESLFDNVPQDIEWAISGGALYMLQSRPITNLPPQPLPDTWEPLPPAKYLVRRQIVENVTGPVCPLFEELYLIEGLQLEFPGGKADSEEWNEMMEGPLYVTVNGYAYQRMDWKKIPIPGLTDKAGGTTEADMAAAEEEAAKKKQELQQRTQQRQEEVAETVQHDLDLFLAGITAEDRRSFETWAKTADVEDLAYAVTTPEMGSSALTGHGRTEPGDQLIRDWQERAMPELHEAADKWRDVDPVEAPAEQLLEGIRELAHAEGRYWSGRNVGRIFGVIKSSDDQFQQFLAEYAPDHHLISGQFLSGYASKNMEANEHLHRISRMIQANDALHERVVVTPAKRLMKVLKSHSDAGPVVEAIAEYLRIYGHMGYTLDFVEPPMVEDPAPLFTTLKTMVQDSAYDPKKHEVEASRNREAAFEKAEQVFSGLTYWQYRFRLWYAQRYYPFRDDMLFPLGMTWPMLRSFASEVGRRLVDVGTFLQPDDTYYLKMGELRESVSALAENKALREYGPIAAERRELREAQKALRPPSAIPAEISGNPWIKEVQVQNDPSSDILRGIAVSPGS
ncbi:MAG: PEP/pyruvate-binding domain-containing protein, partial [Desulfobacterales bacterium]